MEQRNIRFVTLMSHLMQSLNLNSSANTYKKHFQKFTCKKKNNSAKYKKLHCNRRDEIKCYIRVK